MCTHVKNILMCKIESIQALKTYTVLNLIFTALTIVAAVTLRILFDHRLTQHAEVTFFAIVGKLVLDLFINGLLLYGLINRKVGAFLPYFLMAGTELCTHFFMVLSCLFLLPSFWWALVGGAHAILFLWKVYITHLLWGIYQLIKKSTPPAAAAAATTV